MKSKVFVTEQMDTPEQAAAELLAGIGADWELEENTAGILMCYSDAEIGELAAALEEKAGFPIIGTTCIASMDSIRGFHEMAATLLVLTADDTRFSVALSDEINPDNVRERVEGTYRRAEAELGGEPGMVVAIPPYLLEIMLDEYTQAFNQVAPGVPVVGGLPSNNSNGDYNRTVCKGNSYENRMAILAMRGNIHPVFSVQNVVGNVVERKRKVTEARDNVVYRVGNQTFVEYLREVGLPLDKLADANNTITFVSNPLLLESGEGREDFFSFARTLHEVDLEKGTGTAIGRIPEGATISICSLRREEIEEAAGAGMDALNKKMAKAAKKGYQYSTVLAVSCIGRHLLMLPHGDAETRRILPKLPEGLSLAGFYGYGEIGPQGMGKTSNFAHNESLILCAF